MEENNINGSGGVAEKSDGKGNNKMTVLMIVIVIAVVAVIGVYFLISNQNSSTPTVENQDSQTQDSAMTPEENMESTDSGSMQNVMDEKTVKNIDVEGTDFAYTPSTIEVSAGDFVHLVFTNKGKYPHDLAIPDLDMTTKTINPGESDSIDFTASKAGSYSFYCTVDSHKDKGMVGTLNVN